MKKILSAVLALVMVAATFTMLVPTATAAEETPASTLVYSTDFEYDFGEGVKTSSDKGAIALKSGMHFQTIASGTTVEVANDAGDNHALHIQTGTTETGGSCMMMVEEEALIDGFEMYADVKLVTPADSNALHIAGHHNSVHSTWNVVYRGGTEARFLNGLKYTGVDGNGDPKAVWVTHYTTNDYAYGSWYTLHIVMDPTQGVTFRAKATNGGQWSEAVTYGNDALANLSKSTNYLSGIIGIHVNDTKADASTDVYLDNISVYTNKKQVVVYENDFNDAALAAKTDADLMQALNWRYTDSVGWHSSYEPGLLSIDSGALKMLGTTTPSGFGFQMKAKELVGGYTVSFRMKQIQCTTASGDSGLTFGGNDQGTNREGSWMLQLRNNGGVVNGGRYLNGENYAWYGVDVANKDVYVTKDNESGVKGRADGQWFTVTFHVSNELGNRVSIRRDSDGAYTYRDRQNATERAYCPEAYNEYLRIVGYNSTDFIIDDLKIVAYKDVTESKTTTVYENGFDVADSTDQAAIMSTNEWTLLESNMIGEVARNSVSIQDGRLVVNNAVAGGSGQTSFVMVNDERLPFAENIVLEYDFEFLDVLKNTETATYSEEAAGFWTGDVTGRGGLVVHTRPVGKVLAGANYDGWKDYKYHITNMMSPKATATSTSGQENVTVGSRFSVRVELSDKEMYVYIKDYNLDRDWDAYKDLAAVTHFGSVTQGKMLLDQYLRFVCYNGLSVAIDNVKVTAENVGAKFYGYQYTELTGNARDIRLIGLINSDMRQDASAVGYKVTMTKVDGSATATKEISCNYVYSSITDWGDGITQPGQMVNCATNIYALHITGVNAAVEIEVTPFYDLEEGATRVYGTTSSFTFDPANPPT